MILVVSTCRNKLAEQEFVRPVVDIIQGMDDYRTVHYKKVSLHDTSFSDKIIICGTQLKDNEYLEHLSRFDWVKNINKPLLGICAGMQVIALQNGARIVKETAEIGMTDIMVVKSTALAPAGNLQAYALHNLSVTVPQDFVKIAESKKCVQGIMHAEKPVYGVLFHPEARNKQIIEHFINL